MVDKKRVITITKDKATGVVLAVFLGIFAWCYTWKFDKTKFWLSLVTIILMGWTVIVPIGIWIWVIVDMSMKDNDKYVNYGKYKKE